jgi:hypothetical protein
VAITVLAVQSVILTLYCWRAPRPFVGSAAAKDRSPPFPIGS